MEELAGKWRQLQNEKLHYPYTSLITDRVIKSGIQAGLWHVWWKEEMRAGFGDEMWKKKRGDVEGRGTERRVILREP